MIKIPRFLVNMSWRELLFIILVVIIFAGIKELVLPPTKGTPSQVLERFYKDMSNSSGSVSKYFLGEVSPETKAALSVFDISGYCGYDDRGVKNCANSLKIHALSILLEKSDTNSATALVEGVLVPDVSDAYYFSNEFPRRYPSQRVVLKLVKDKLGRIG